jgi:hypothetical protein
MNKLKSLLAVAAIASLVTVPAHAGVKEIGVVNGVHLVRVKNLGIFVPSQVTLLAYTPGKEGVEVIAHAGGPGVVPAVATAGGVVGGAALLRPARSKTSSSAYGAGGTGGAGVVAGTISDIHQGSGGGGNGGGTINGGIHTNNHNH